MRYIQNKQSNKSFVKTMLEKILESINGKLSDIRELSIKEGNQNWKKSKLAIILLTIKKLIFQIMELYFKKPRDKSKRKIWNAEIKQLLLKLKITITLANNEMQIQKERLKEKVLSKAKEKVFTPTELVMLNQLQNTR